MQPPKPKKPKPKKPKTAYISFSADFNPHTSESLLAVCSQLANQGAKVVYLMIASPGGSVDNGLNVYHVLRGMPFRLITHNVGSVNSIATVVFLAGEERYAVPGSTFMFHGVGLTFDGAGKARLEEKQLIEALDRLQADQRKIGTVVSDRSNLSTEEVGKLFLQAVTKSAEYARDTGMVHDIREVKIPRGTPITQLVFKR